MGKSSLFGPDTLTEEGWGVRKKGDWEPGGRDLDVEKAVEEAETDWEWERAMGGRTARGDGVAEGRGGDERGELAGELKEEERPAEKDTAGTVRREGEGVESVRRRGREGRRRWEEGVEGREAILGAGSIRGPRAQIVVLSQKIRIHSRRCLPRSSYSFQRLVPAPLIPLPLPRRSRRVRSSVSPARRDNSSPHQMQMLYSSNEHFTTVLQLSHHKYRRSTDKLSKSECLSRWSSESQSCFKLFAAYVPLRVASQTHTELLVHVQ